MGFLSLSDATALGVTQGIEDTLAGIKQQEDKDLKDARRKAENAAAAAKDITIKYEAREKAAETTGQGLLKNAAFKKAVDRLKTEYPDQFSNVSDLQIAARFGKSFITHHARDKNDSPLKFAIRSAQTLNEQIGMNSVDPNLLSLNTVDTPTDTQTRELTAMEKMTPKGRRMEMEQSYRPSGIGGEAFDTAMLGGVPTVPVTQTESLVKSAREPNTRAEQKYQNEALLTALEFSAPTDTDGSIDFSASKMNKDSPFQQSLTPDEIIATRQKLFVLRGKFDAFLNKMDIAPVDQDKIFRAAQTFRKLFINEKFMFNEELFNKVNPNNIDQLMQEVEAKRKKDNKNKKPNTILVPIDPNQTSKPNLLKNLEIETLRKKLINQGLKPEEIEKQIELEKEKSFLNNKPGELKRAERSEKLLRIQKKATYPFILEYGDMLIEYTSASDPGTIMKDKTDG